MADNEPVTPRGQRPARIGEAFPSVLIAAQSGGSSAFDRLYRAFAPSVVGYLRMQGAADPVGTRGGRYRRVRPAASCWAAGRAFLAC